MFNEQQVVLRTFETDTARALATADSRARTFVDELRTEIFQSKAQKVSERERAEQRITQKIDEVKRSLENYVKKPSQLQFLSNETFVSCRIVMKNVLKTLYVNSNVRI